MPASASAPAEPAARALDTAAQKVLLIGDSMVINLVQPLADYCLENGHQLYPVTWWGSNTLGWAKTQKLDALIKWHKPTMVVIALGSSELHAKDISKHAAWVRTILQKIGELKVVWIGPPNRRPDTGLNAMLTRELGQGRYFQSTHLQLKRVAEDDIHPTPKASAEWMDAVASWIEKKSDVALRMAKPTRPAPKPHVRVYKESFWESRQNRSR